jgi:hypothetical protein
MRNTNMDIKLLKYKSSSDLYKQISRKQTRSLLCVRKKLQKIGSSDILIGSFVILFNASR